MRERECVCVCVCVDIDLAPYHSSLSKLPARMKALCVKEIPIPN